jgi:alanine dehydrogenase
MRVGVVRERKESEQRVALTPTGAQELTRAGHHVLVETGAGEGSGFDDSLYVAAGAQLVDAAAGVWTESELLLKVKEPIPEEYCWLRADLTVFCYLHLAADAQLTRALTESGATGIAYETIEDRHGRFPLLEPMSEIAGRLAAQTGAHYLQAPAGGPGVLMGGAPGTRPARVLIIGGGVVGTQAARVAAGMGAAVCVLERSHDRIRSLERQLAGDATVLMSDRTTLEQELEQADLVLGSVLIPGARAPHIVTRAMLAGLRPAAVLVDVAIDQGGCIETSRPTTHSAPVFHVDGILHYCVANMPASVPVTATRALTNATLPHVHALADLGVAEAAAADPGLKKGINVQGGAITCPPVAAAHREPRPAPASDLGAGMAA